MVEEPREAGRDCLIEMESHFEIPDIAGMVPHCVVPVTAEHYLVSQQILVIVANIFKPPFPCRLNDTSVSGTSSSKVWIAPLGLS